MFQLWAYFTFAIVVSSCVSAMELRNIDKGLISVQKSKNQPDTKIRRDIRYIHNVLGGLDQNVNPAVKNIKELKDLDSYKSKIIAHDIDAQNSDTRQRNSLKVRNRLDADAAEEVILNTRDDCRRPRSCLELQRKGHTASGLYKIYVASLEKMVLVGIFFVFWSLFVTKRLIIAILIDIFQKHVFRVSSHYNMYFIINI